MRSAHRVETVRTAERTLMARLPDGALMQRAAAGLAAACADILPRRVYGSRVVVLTGSGDNGGDALYAGARLARRGAGVTAVLLSPDRTHQAALAADADDAVQDEVGAADVGVVGIGGKGGLRPEAARLAALAAASPATVVAVDLPSGIEADTGEVHGEAVRADLTVTFGTHKPGLLVDPARTYAGSVRLVDIGLADTLPATPALESLQHT
ncbi:NAD(P)H-hydrate epimerase, partial [Streptomyces scabiei]|uniref:NAD(P)H-hydrate epimerase n=1 Tax=Streptomyces scabiei TaxID=1930 RepID=UPI0029B35D31